MTFPRNLTGFNRSLVSGVIANVAAVAPALAAPSLGLASMPFDVSTLSGRDMLLYSSIALLVVSLIAKVVRDRHDSEPAPAGPDLRWWKNPPPNPQT
jgi:hypothetical protein